LTVGGASLCGLAALFLWRDLQLGSEYFLVLLALAATALGIARRPRARPELGVQLLVACAAIAALWLAAFIDGLVDDSVFHWLPILLALGIALGGAIAVAFLTPSWSDEAHAERLTYSLVAIALVASWAFYYRIFTVGFAADQVARRMVLTGVWLAAGLVLLMRRDALATGGRVLVVAAVAKALLYDTSHLHGPLRIVLLLGAGGLLLGGAWITSRRSVNKRG
jgi:hypothetical protein